MRYRGTACCCCCCLAPAPGFAAGAAAGRVSCSGYMRHNKQIMGWNSACRVVQRLHCVSASRAWFVSGQDGQALATHQHPHTPPPPDQHLCAHDTDKLTDSCCDVGENVKAVGLALRAAWSHTTLLPSGLRPNGALWTPPAAAAAAGPPAGPSAETWCVTLRPAVSQSARQPGRQACRHAGRTV